jgi:Na+/melibiose symporter-like transporter
MISGVLIFIVIFELGPGPITWLYMAEIMQDKGSSIATVMNWGINLLISYFVPVIIQSIGPDNVGYIFYFMGAASVLGTLFVAVFMKETKGKSVAQIEEMFDKSNRDVSYQKRAANDSNFNST